jgi:hypothetical protein
MLHISHRKLGSILFQIWPCFDLGLFSSNQHGMTIGGVPVTQTFGRNSTVTPSNSSKIIAFQREPPIYTLSASFDILRFCINLNLTSILVWHWINLVFGHQYCLPHDWCYCRPPSPPGIRGPAVTEVSVRDLRSAHLLHKWMKYPLGVRIIQWEISQSMRCMRPFRVNWSFLSDEIDWYPVWPAEPTPRNLYYSL